MGFNTQLASKHPGGAEWSLDDVQHLGQLLPVEEDFNKTAAVKALRAWLRKQKWAR
jgi:hypothetical protein